MPGVEWWIAQARKLTPEPCRHCTGGKYIPKFIVGPKLRRALVEQCWQCGDDRYHLVHEHPAQPVYYIPAGWDASLQPYPDPRLYPLPPFVQPTPALAATGVVEPGDADRVRRTRRSGIYLPKPEDFAR